jgi:Asp/Glu/hydantoin racemase
MIASRIAMIHALEESMPPARAAFAEAWPEAYCFDILETSLAVDRAEAGRLDNAMIRRFEKLADYAASSSGYGGQTAAILFTCSAFGPAIDVVKASTNIPVLRPNEAAFSEALELGSRFLLAVTFPPSRESLEIELQAMARVVGKAIHVETVLVGGALAALKAGDGARHDALAVETIERHAADVDAIILGQFSLARAKAAIEPRVRSIPVITTPHSAVRAIRKLTGCAEMTTGAGREAHNP